MTAVLLDRAGPVNLSVAAPPSKSLTHRALVAAALATGPSLLCGPLLSGDTRLTVAGLRRLGAAIEVGDRVVGVEGTGEPLAGEDGAVLDCGNSGTTLRFLASVAALSGARVTLTGSDRMRERPVRPLAGALGDLGASVAFPEREGFPPVEVSGPLLGGRTAMGGEVSSQFASSLLLAAPLMPEGLDLRLVSPPVSRSYLDLTLGVMARFGARTARRGYERFAVGPGPYRGTAYAVEGDWSSASYLFALAAALGGRVTVPNLDPGSAQGDRRFVAALGEMGCRVSSGPGGVTVEREGPLRGIDVEMSSAPDTVQTLAVVAALAGSPTRIAGVGHLRHKESDRLAVTADRLRSLGAGARVEEDALVVVPGPLSGGTVDPEGDHRTAMAFAVLGLAVGRVAIEDPGCVEKSWPGFWDALRGAGLL
ncbi:MAG: 3-phosphoshikimate 1-carboxyvinyltransferase [Methanospirillum sp.]|nr:3-phosphoshikimate 1-carboxyvinyltransferase [Methanospirillum sp.]